MKIRHWAAALALSVLNPLAAHATTIVTYTFDSGSATLVNPGVSVSDPNITNISAWTDRDNALVANGLVGNPSTGRAIAATSFGSGGNPGNEFQFSFTVNGTLALDGFSFWEQGSNGNNGSGPGSWALFVNSQQVATGNTVLGQPGGSESGPLSLTGLTGVVNVGIFASGASNDTTATWRVDNFTFTGNVSAVPLPPALLLFGSALVPLVMRRRRQV